MLPPAERLRKPGLFKRFYAARKSVGSPLVTLYVLPRQPGSQARLPLVGFVVAKKVHNKATRRNLAKRRLREAYRKSRLDLESIKQWYAVVWVVQEKALGADWEEVCRTIPDLIEQANRKFGKARDRQARESTPKSEIS